MNSFSHSLCHHKKILLKAKISTLQINLGFLCNLTCSHCHLAAGPDRKEKMGKETARQLVSFADKHRFPVIDITGGSPELNPNLFYLLENLAPLTERLILRSNLTALGKEKFVELAEVCRENNVVIIASFPALNEVQAESQRGTGVFAKSLESIAALNVLGYGKKGSGLELNLVSNPTGAFLPSGQEQLAKRFKQILKNKWGLEFNDLFSFANVPLGRFKDWLAESANLEQYMSKLINSFNPCAVEGVMCRSMISVGWDGHLYDCDFNQAVGLFMGGEKIHLSQLAELPSPGSQIALADHCYACTSGAGFT